MSEKGASRGINNILPFEFWFSYWDMLFIKVKLYSSYIN